MQRDEVAGVATSSYLPTQSRAELRCHEDARHKFSPASKILDADIHDAPTIQQLHDGWTWTIGRGMLILPNRDTIYTWYEDTDTARGEIKSDEGTNRA